MYDFDYLLSWLHQSAFLQLENKSDNTYHKISAKVYDPRDQFERSKLQHHNKNGRKINFGLIPDSK